MKKKKIVPGGGLECLVPGERFIESSPQRSVDLLRGAACPPPWLLRELLGSVFDHGLTLLPSSAPTPGR